MHYLSLHHLNNPKLSWIHHNSRVKGRYCVWSVCATLSDNSYNPSSHEFLFQPVRPAASNAQNTGADNQIEKTKTEDTNSLLSQSSLNIPLQPPYQSYGDSWGPHSSGSPPLWTSQNVRTISKFWTSATSLLILKSATWAPFFGHHLLSWKVR